MGETTNNIVIIGAVALVALAGIAAIRYFGEDKNKKQTKQDDRYIWHKKTIEKGDFDYLEKLKNTRMQDYPDLIAMIDEALKKKSNTDNS